MFSDFESNKTTSSLRAEQVVYDSNKRSIMNLIGSLVLMMIYFMFNMLQM
nr:MAG TPA: hypothetical protein [Caudoviricetes sp.]